MAPPLLLAHRGDHRRHAENSLDAMLAGLAVPGLAGLEFDVRISRDGIPVVLHDETLARVQGRPERAVDLSAADLGVMGVPRLADVLAACPSPAFLDVELKEDVGEAALAVLGAARGRPDGSLERVVVSAFEAASLATVLRSAPAVACWLNVDEPVTAALVNGAARLGCRGISVEWERLDRRGVDLAAAAGLDVAAWTVTSRAALARMAGLGVVAACVEGAALPG